MNAVDTYEALRNQILNGAARPQGLSVILYHGILRGLQILAMKPITPSYQAEIIDAIKPSASHDADLVRLVANMVLHINKKSEIKYAY